jgi:Delta3,5-Delta2,4-dienoyl-CoA isomerase
MELTGEGLHYTAVWNSAALQTKDIQAALLSGMEKRVPRFDKL